MGASPLQPASRRRRSVPRRGPSLDGCRISALAACLLAGVLSSCNAQDTAAKAAPKGSTSIAASPAPTTVDEQAALLLQYRKFWSSLTPVSRMPAAQRRDVLAELAVDPALKSLLAGMAEADAKKQVLYGENVPRPTARVNPDATTALVDDCQDSSSAGVADKQTDKRLTVGIPRNRVSVTMKKQPGGLWKVAYIDYANSPC